MAAIPPFHEDPPVGTNNLVPPPGLDKDVRAEEGAPAPPVDQQPSLPADWSPVDPAPAEDPGPLSSGDPSR
jgi:hypothetical protein